MRKLLPFFLLCMATMPAFSQTNKAFDGRLSNNAVVFGVRGGVNFDSFGKDVASVFEGNLKNKSHTGWNIGIVVDCPILECLYFQPGVFYKTKGFKLTESKGIDSRKVLGRARYIEFPLLFSYRYKIRQGITWEINLGPYIGVGLGGTVKDIKYKEKEIEEGMYRSDGLNTDFAQEQEIVERNFFGNNLEDSFGIKKTDIGLAIGTGMTINRFYIGFQYDLGLSNLRDETCWAKNIKFKSRSATILLGFNIFRTK